jgi:protein-S-isoprenylcysteine O-methyltransferase Ste14
MATLPTLDLRIPPPVVALLVAAAMWALARWLPLVEFQLPRPWLTGGLVALLGFGVSLAGVLQFKRARTTVNPLHPDRASALVVTGIYRHTRNPMYAGMALVLVGCFLAFGGLSALVGLPAFMAYISRFQIQPEERALQVRFGRDFSDYQSRVGRWL